MTLPYKYNMPGRLLVKHRRYLSYRILYLNIATCWCKYIDLQKKLVWFLIEINKTHIKLRNIETRRCMKQNNVIRNWKQICMNVNNLEIYVGLYMPWLPLIVCPVALNALWTCWKLRWHHLINVGKQSIEPNVGQRHRLVP